IREPPRQRAGGPSLAAAWPQTEKHANRVETIARPAHKPDDFGSERGLVDKPAVGSSFAKTGGLAHLVGGSERRGNINGVDLGPIISRHLGDVLRRVDTHPIGRAAAAPVSRAVDSVAVLVHEHDHNGINASAMLDLDEGNTNDGSRSVVLITEW